MRASTFPVMSRTASGTLAALCAVAVVASTLVWPTAFAVGSPARPMAIGADCPVVAESDALAAEVAVRCGQDVEVLDERTEWQTL